jgi:hypothetical protein
MYRTLLSLTFLSLLAIGCKSQGSIEGELSPSKAPSASKSGDRSGDAKSGDAKSGDAKSSMEKPAAAKHEHVSFTWESGHAGHSGKMQAKLPDGEAFSGQFHEITASTTVTNLDGFYRSWYGGPWARYDWTWGGDWPYYGVVDEYITYYTDRIVAILEGDRGDSMRCHFKLDDPGRGMKGGGQGECQVSNGDRITAVFAAT